MDLLDLLIQEANERNRDNRLEEFQDELNSYLNFYRRQEDQEREVRSILHQLRHDFPYEQVIKKGGVFITENERCNIKELCAKETDLFKLHGRLIFPILSPMEKILGLIGWDPTAVPKYLDSRNIGYVAKASSFFNMQIIPDIIDSRKTVFIVEGTWCAMWLEHLGFNAFAMLGSKVGKRVKQILRLLGPSRFVFIWDDDDAGHEAIEDMKKTFPESRFLCVSKYNDIDEARRYVDLLPDLIKISEGNFDLTNFHNM